MVMEYGMSDALGLPTYGSGSGNPFLGQQYGYLGGGNREYSEESARSIDEEVKQILNQSYEKALSIIRANQDKMVELAKTLMEVETLDREEFEIIMNKPGNGQMPDGEPIANEESELTEPLMEESTLDSSA